MALTDALAQMYASDVISGFDIYKPEKLNVLFMRYGDQGASYFQLLRSMGFEKIVSNDTYGHYEDKRMHETVKVASQVAAPGAGADLTIALHADSVTSSASTAKYYPRVYDTVMFKNEVVGFIASITWNATVFDVVITPYDETDEIPQVEAGEELIIISSAFSEGSGQPESALSGAWEYDNEVQIIKETFGATGSEMTNQDWFNVTSEGQKIPAIYYKGQSEIDYRLALKIDGALLFNKRVVGATQAVDATTGRVIKTTEGLIPYIRRVGNEHPYTVGSFDIADFDDINLVLDREHAGNYTLALLGIQLQTEIEDVLKAYFSDTNINFTKQIVNDVLFHKNESLSASVNFKYLTKSERTYLFKRMGVFSNPKTFGNTNAIGSYDMPNMGVMIPINKRKDPKSKEMVNSLGCRYKGLGRYSRRMEVWSVGGAGEGLKVTEFDTRDTYVRSHVGGHYRGGNSMVLIDPS